MCLVHAPLARCTKKVKLAALSPAWLRRVASCREGSAEAGEANGAAPLLPGRRPPPLRARAPRACLPLRRGLSTCNPCPFAKASKCSDRLQAFEPSATACSARTWRSRAQRGLEAQAASAALQKPRILAWRRRAWAHVRRGCVRLVCRRQAYVWPAALHLTPSTRRLGQSETPTPLRGSVAPSVSVRRACAHVERKATALQRGTGREG